MLLICVRPYGSLAMGGRRGAGQSHLYCIMFLRWGGKQDDVHVCTGDAGKSFWQDGTLGEFIVGREGCVPPIETLTKHFTGVMTRLHTAIHVHCRKKVIKGFVTSVIIETKVQLLLFEGCRTFKFRGSTWKL